MRRRENSTPGRIISINLLLKIFPMKKASFFLIAFISVFQAAAQETDTTVVSPKVVFVDSLTIRLNKLQHNYDYLECEYVLNKTITELKLLSNDIRTLSNSLLIDIYHGIYTDELYNSYVDNYIGCCFVFDNLKDQIDTVRILVDFKMSEGDFSRSQLDVLNSGLSVMLKSTNVVEASLDYFYRVLKAYKNKK